MKVAILIPVHNHIEFTLQALSALGPVVNNEINVVVIDDGSVDGTYELIKSGFPKTIVLKGDGNLWWSGAVNAGAKYAIDKLGADFILLWNNDITFEKDYFQKLRHILDNTDNQTIIGSKIYVKEKPELIWSMGGVFNPNNGKYHMIGYYQNDSEKYNKTAQVDWLTGMGTIVPTHIINKIGGWDEKNFPLYHGDSDFTYRAKLQGYSIIVNPDLKIYNNVINSGIEHNGNMKQLFKLVTDIKSKANFKRYYIFYKKYSKSKIAYYPLFILYFKLFAGFFKWKILKFIGLKKKKVAVI